MGSCSIAARNMSKSVGNVIDPFELVERYGLDQLRYFLMREVPFGQDGSYSHEAIVNRTNADLANDLGNLAQRSLSMIAKNCEGAVCRSPAHFPRLSKAILDQADAALETARKAMDDQALHLALGAIFAVVAEANRYFAGRSHGHCARPILRAWAPCLYSNSRGSAAASASWCSLSSRNLRRSCSIFWLSRLTSASLPMCWQARLLVGPIWPAAAGLPAPRGSGRTELSLMMLVDSHCHLDFADFEPERDAVVQRALDAGIKRMVTISTRVRKFDAIRTLAETYEAVHCSVGTHPNDAHEELDITADDLVRLAEHPKVVA